MNKTITKEHILFVAIGAFTFLVTSSIAYFIGLVFSDFLIFTKQNPFIIIAVKNGIQIITFVLILYLILRLLLKQKELNFAVLKKQLIWLIILYFLCQLIEALYSQFGIQTFEGYVEALNVYSDYITTFPFILIVSSFVYYIQLVLFTIIIVNYTTKDDR